MTDTEGHGGADGADHKGGDHAGGGHQAGGHSSGGHEGSSHGGGAHEGGAHEGGGASGEHQSGGGHESSGHEGGGHTGGSHEGGHEGGSHEGDEEKKEEEGGLTIIRDVKQVFGGKGFSLTSDHVTTKLCKPCKCEWKKKIHIIHVHYSRVFITNIRCSQLDLAVIFEYNGCDLNDAHIAISTSSFISWYMDSTTYSLSAKGSESKLEGKSGCPACCDKSKQIVFEIALTFTTDWGVTVVPATIEVTISGDGTVDSKKI